MFIQPKKQQVHSLTVYKPTEFIQQICYQVLARIRRYLEGISASPDMFVLPVRVAEWLRSPPLKQSQSDQVGPGYPGAGKLDSGFQFGRTNEYQLIKLGLKSGPQIHFGD